MVLCNLSPDGDDQLKGLSLYVRGSMPRLSQMTQLNELQLYIYMEYKYSDIQWNSALRTPLKSGHLRYCGHFVWS